MFEEIKKIEFEGIASKNPLSFKFYDADKKIGNKTMKEHLRFSLAYWHSFASGGADIFGAPTLKRSYKEKDSMDLAKKRMEVAFSFMKKLGFEYFCFHDRDIAPEGENLSETNKNLDIIVEMIKKLSVDTGIKVLWNTANLFSHPRYMNGAATSPNSDIFAYAAAQVKKSLDIAKEIGSENFVFWGGREGYDTLLNTCMAIENDNMARFFDLAISYAKKIGFKGQFLIEPKPKEPTKHQYDFDCATVLAFLQKYNLTKYFKLNIEANHATLAGHNFHHELAYARINNMLGSVDANRGDLLLGWDTDQFPFDVYSTTLAMYEILKNGGLGSGGLNFDAKVRRASFDEIDLVYAHIVGMDVFAKGLIVAHKLLEDKVLEGFVQERYSSYKKGIGEKIINKEVGLEELEEYVLKGNLNENASGRQEYLEGIINSYLFS